MLIHCTMDELLAIRDGEGSQAASRHLDECDECSHELNLLHQRVAALKTMPTLNPPRDRWSVVRDEVLAGRAKKRRQFVGWLGAAAAASVMLTLGVGQLVVSAAREPDPLAELVNEAQSLEQALRVFRPESRVMSGRVATAVAALEDRLFALEVRFGRAQQRRASREQVIRLWEERVGLMGALVEVRRAPVTYVGF
ncbi:MAG: hypothetical protein IH876_03700 [Gemmatimonadetes bacterium]|nr:hypothetical protein [Gemmatimonadota bacterium]